ncbi:MAG: ABC transporter ATP-binding protein [Nocardioidaceae bacterium]
MKSAQSASLTLAVSQGAGPDAASPALLARDLYRFFRAGDEETLALRDVSLSVTAGEVVVVVGPSGSGKSTLLSCLAGLDEPSGGSVWVAGQRVSHQTEAVRARLRARHIGVLFQADNLFTHLRVEANVRLAQTLAADRPLPPVTELLASLGIDHRSTAHPQELSGGEAARAGLAVALANDPGVLLADEPTGELDGESERRLLEMLCRRARAGCAVVIASHSVAVRRIADRVIALQDGRLMP